MLGIKRKMFYYLHMELPKDSQIDQDQLLAEEWDQLRVSLVWAYEEPIGTARNVAKALDTLHRAWLIRKGSVVLKDHLRNTEFTVVAGHWVIISEDNFYGQYFSPDAEIMSIAFRANWADGQRLLPTPFCVRLEAGRHPGLEAPAVRLCQQSVTPGETGYRRRRKARLTLDTHLVQREIFYGWLRQLIAILGSHGIHARRHQTNDERVQRAHALLPDMGFSGAVDYERLCREASLSRAQLDRLFIRDYGMSVRECRDRMCIARASEMLHMGSFQVAEIADDLGFKTPSHFCAWFRRKIGRSPGAFRKTRR